MRMSHARIMYANSTKAVYGLIRSLCTLASDVIGINLGSEPGKAMQRVGEPLNDYTLLLPPSYIMVQVQVHACQHFTKTLLFCCYIQKIAANLHLRLSNSKGLRYIMRQIKV